MTTVSHWPRLIDPVSPRRRAACGAEAGAGRPTPDEALSHALVDNEAAVDLVAVGASTGGPQALVTLFGVLAPRLSDFRTCVSLHMPSELMPIVARHVAERCGVAVEVVRTTTVFAKGIVYFLPGDMDFGFTRTASDIRIWARSVPADRACGPAVDRLLAAAAIWFGNGTLGVVLSGMGKDGLAGARAVVGAGGKVVVQDKESSAVWGMPGSVAKAGLASAILSPTELGQEIARRAARVRHPE